MFHLLAGNRPPFYLKPMRLIGTLPTETDARRFVDYLLTRTIAAHAEEGGDAAWQVWVEDDDQLDVGRAELDQFRQAPADARFDSAADAAALRKREAKAAEKRRRNFRDVRTTMFAMPNRSTPVTMAIVGVCVVVFLLINRGGPGGDNLFRAMLFNGLNLENLAASHDVPAGLGSRWLMFSDVAAGQVWRLVAPAFLHRDFLHLLFNMLWMLDLGRRIEPMKGSVRLLLLVLVTAVLSNSAEALWTAFSPWQTFHFVRFLGLSGVVSGLFGYAWACGRLRPHERIFVTQQETGYFIGWLVICSFGFIGNIANAAHWGGLVIGAILGAAPTWWRKVRGR